MPTLDDIVTILNRAKYFSKLDLAEGYQQLELEEESRKITTFLTRRYKRLRFGVNAAAEVSHDVTRQVLPDKNSVINVSDDILVAGRTLREHATKLCMVLRSLEEAGFTLNLKKSKV